jgi:hypothetical protein
LLKFCSEPRLPADAQIYCRSACPAVPVLRWWCTDGFRPPRSRGPHSSPRDAGPRLWREASGAVLAPAAPPQLQQQGPSRLSWRAWRLFGAGAARCAPSAADWEALIDMHTYSTHAHTHCAPRVSLGAADFYSSSPSPVEAVGVAGYDAIFRYGLRSTGDRRAQDPTQAVCAVKQDSHCGNLAGVYGAAWADAGAVALWLQRRRGWHLLCRRGSNRGFHIGNVPLSVRPTDQPQGTRPLYPARCPARCSGKSGVHTVGPT